MLDFYNFLEALKSVGGFGITPGWNPETKNLHPDKYTDPVQVKHFLAMAKKPSEEKGIIAKLDDIFQRKGHIEQKDLDIHIYFGSMSLNSFPEEVKGRSLYQKYQNYFFNYLKIPKTDIVYIKTVPGGDVWKPWIVIHGLAHAIYYDKVVNNHLELTKIYSIYNLFNDFFSNLMPPLFFDKLKKRGYYSDLLDQMIVDVSTRIDFIAPVFKFKSAQQSEISGPGEPKKFGGLTDKQEFIFEVFTWYIWNGQKLPRPQISDFVKSKYSTLFDYKSPEQFVEAFNELFTQLEDIFRSDLDKIKGHVVID